MKAKATELMIGDWVYGLVVDEGNDLDKIIDRVPSKVTMINEFGDIYTQGPFPIDDEEYDGEWEWYDIEPIPLTSEILEKNGFTHCDYEGSELLDAFCWVEFNEARNGCMINRASIKVTLYKKPIMGVSVLTEIDTYSAKGDGVNKVHSCDIESVHELQHALRLCGIEKEIIL